jgi:NUMOD3 motif
MSILFYLLSLVFIRISFTLSPNNIDSNWLTLATGTSNSAQTEEIDSTSHNVQDTRHAVEQLGTIGGAGEVQNKEKAPIKKKRKRGEYDRIEEVKNKQKSYWTPERRLKQSELSRRMRLGKMSSEEGKERQPNPNIGKKASESTREKIRKSHLGKKPSEATKQKMRDAKQRKRQERIANSIASNAEKEAP